MNIVMAFVAVVLVAWVSSLELRLWGVRPWAEGKFARKRRSKKEVK